MRTRDSVSPQKLRGGFYSPPVLVNLCLDRIASRTAGRQGLRVLEPSVGDGAFIRGLTGHASFSSVGEFTGVEVVPSEATQAVRELAESGLAGEVVEANVLDWYATSRGGFDVVVANPPYVRFQFIDESDKERSRLVAERVGVAGASVSNLWIAVFLLALDSLREGGAFAVILPTEFLTGVSAARVRSWLLANAADLHIDLFKPGSFPSVLQEVLVLSGVRSAKAQSRESVVRFTDHNGSAREWEHAVDPEARTWTEYLLSPLQVAFYRAALSMREVERLGGMARFSVSTVTGANAFFCLTDAEVERRGLQEWSTPLLARIRQAPGLVLTEADHEDVAARGKPVWMLSFSAGREDPRHHPGAWSYIAEGEAQSLHLRLKTRTRRPWYRVPVVPPGTLLLSKRSNEFPRVVANHARVVTTDTVYRGVATNEATMPSDALAAIFHNSLTLLSAEIEGRSFGGGVLELVPSEIASLQVPRVASAAGWLEDLDRTYRSGTGESVIAQTDSLIATVVESLGGDMMAQLSDARETLRARRIARSSEGFYQ